ncbi:hypothetical protein [Pseudoalteromonas sp. T1lg48]|uniref:hypothetical protein n=2 Tax=unclassified Pseudoalteromonas TaxID=194690 RepID=UPI000CF660BB|nr:hypothetical protein [Pseudoalteromonas sp. T1lg48]
MYRSFILSALSIAVLAGCGGSGDSSSTKTPEPSGKTLTITAVYRDACGNETPDRDAALIIHNADYSNKATVYADDNGVISYPTTNGSETFSLVRLVQEKIDGITPVDLLTFVDHPVIDLGKNAFQTGDSSACECRTSNVQVDVPARVNSYVERSMLRGAMFDTYQKGTGSVTYQAVTQCKQSGSEQWPQLSVVNQFSSPEQAYGALFADLNDGGTTEVAAELIGTPVVINSYMSYKQVSAIVDNGNHLYNYAFNGSNDVYAFTHESIENHSITAYEYENLDNPTGDGYIFTSSTVRTKEVNQTFDLPPIALSVDDLASVLTLDGQDYDIAESGVDYAFIFIGMEASYNNRPLLAWSIFAPPSGTSVNIENLNLAEFIDESALESKVNSLSLSVTARDWGGIAGYEDYMRRRPTRQLSTFNDPEYARAKTKTVQLTVNDLNYSQSALSNLIPTQF